jgi:hypothetical protein
MPAVMIEEAYKKPKRSELSCMIENLTISVSSLDTPGIEADNSHRKSNPVSPLVT